MESLIRFLKNIQTDQPAYFLFLFLLFIVVYCAVMLAFFWLFSYVNYRQRKDQAARLAAWYREHPDCDRR
jgi:flagellar basal body-associated protein FliL